MKIGSVVVNRNDGYKDDERGLIHFKSSLEDTKMIFEDYDEFVDAARETFKDEIERSEAEQAAADDYAYEMYKENEWDDKK